MKETANYRKIYYNPLQIKVNIINARNTIVVAGRATGKTTGIHAPRTAACIMKMPGSSNGFISRTYKQFKTRILGSLVSGYKDLGFKEFNEKTKEGHFVIGKRNREWPSPKYAIGDYSQAIHWFNGSVMPLISQDRPGDANGSNLQSLHGDEAFQLNKDDLDENVIPALRGLSEYSNLSEYRSITLTTSMPLTPDAAWIFDYEKETDPELNEYIMQVYGVWYKKYMALQHNSDKYTEATIRQYNSELNQLQDLLNELRTDYTYYAEADSFENYHVLGEKYFRTQKRILSNEKWLTQIENKRPGGIEIGKRFYPQLASKHFYVDYNNPYFEQFQITLPSEKDTCLGDADCNRTQPLLISIDFGGRIQSMVVAQEKNNIDQINVLKEFYAEQPEYIKHLVDYFNKYYEPMSCRDIEVYYDVSGKKHIGQSSETDIETVQRMLVECGWNVNLIEIETNPLHDDKFEFINSLLSEQDRRIPVLRIHEQNCPNLKVALFNAPIKLSSRGKKEKDKSSERLGSKTAPKQATHITDALDYLLFRRYRFKIEEDLNQGGITLY